MTLRQLTEHNLEFLSLKGGCTSSSESTHAKCHIVGNHMSRLNFSAAHLGLCPVFKLRICSLDWKSSDTTGHDTGLGTGLSLARGSGYCFDFPAAFLFDGMTDFVKG